MVRLPPIVGSNLSGNLLSVNYKSTEDFPTPEFEIEI